MSGFFPVNTAAYKRFEPAAFGRVSRSIVEMAVITGLVLHLYRAVALSRGGSAGWLFLAVTFALGMVILFGMATLHLGSFPVRHWLWRAPTFALIEAGTESLVSLGLIALQREPLGSARAAMGDWPAIMIETILWRLGGVLLYSILLAGVVQAARYLLLRHDHRGHTIEAVHHTAENKGQ